MKHKIGLRALLIVLAFIAVAPCIAIVVYLSVFVQREELARAQDELESVSNLVVANQEHLIEGVRQTLSAIASGPSVRRTDLPELCIEYLRNVQSTGPNYANLGLADLQGNVRCQAVASTQPINVSERRFFKNVIATRKFAVGNYSIGMASGRKVVGFGMPVVDYGNTLHSVAFASVDLAYADRQLKSISLPRHLQVYITDINGNILVSSNRSVDLVGTLVPEPALRSAIIAGQARGLAVPDAHGADWLHVVKPIQGLGRDAIMVVVSVRKSDAVAAAKKQFQVQLAIMAAASLLGLLLASAFARYCIASPVAHLLERMRRVEHGEIGNDHLQSSPQSWTVVNAEFAELDSRFSAMLASLRTQQEQLQKAQEITRIGFFELDLRSQIFTVVSPTIYEILGLDPKMDGVSMAYYRSLIHPDDLEKLDAARERLFAGGKPLHLEYRLIRPDGGIRWLDGFGFVNRDEHGKPTHYSGAIQDVTERRLSEDRARANENRFQLLFENSMDGVLQTELNGRILAANSAACKIFGMSEDQLRDAAGLNTIDDPRLTAWLAERLATGRARGELSMTRADGSRFEAEVTSSVYADASGNMLASIILRDITDRIRSEKDIHQLAFFDALTALPNRRLLQDRLTLLLGAAHRSGEIGAVLFIDLDHFKNVNDARGHATGDVLLQQVARRLTALMRAQDTVARIGGDEFVILLPSLSDTMAEAAQRAMAVAEKALDALTQSFFIGDQPYNTGASIGVTLLPKPGQTTDDLLREADTAMYRAKASGRKQIAFYESDMQTEVEHRLALENDLANAIGTTQLHLALQPQFSHAGEVLGCELLLRWTHPVRGAVPPGVFIPIAEESGLILRLGDWVVQEGCRTLLRLQAANQAMPVSINISPRQFRQPDFVSKIAKTLAETGAPPEQLIFEVTEGVLIENLDDTITRMNELTAHGIRFSIDDFGTGYSSLAYLRRLPLHELKIDRSFVQGIPDDKGNAAIVQMILSMARHLGIRVVAEGVETPEQAAFLRTAGCDAMQGYLLARPMTIDSWLLQQHALA